MKKRAFLFNHNRQTNKQDSQRVSLRAHQLVRRTTSSFLALLTAVSLCAVPSVEAANTDIDFESVTYEEAEEDTFTSAQRNSINMLNYMTVLTQRIAQSSKDQTFLESAYSSLENDLYPNAVDYKTQSQATNLLDTINNYRMIAVKWSRLEYIYEQNRAQALRQAIPDPMSILNIVQSGSPMKMAVSVISMAASSLANYESAASQADLQFLQDGWELEDAESTELHNSTKNALNYMYNMVRDYDLPGDYALNKESVEAFVEWSEKPNLVSKIEWLESNQKTYREFGPYWLELTKDYYNSGKYQKCLDAIHRYEAVSSRIFRKDLDYAAVLPMVIVAAGETMEESDYLKTAEEYCKLILDNTKDEDWSLRYFVAEIYLELYSKTGDRDFVQDAYQLALYNVNTLVDDQRELNANYLEPVQEVEAQKGMTKREQKELKEYNKTLKSERKIALPPVSEALYLNCELLFALAEELQISEEEQNRLNAILHEDQEPLFLVNALDDLFWFGEHTTQPAEEELEVSFDGSKLVLPANCVFDRSEITVTIDHTQAVHDDSSLRVGSKSDDSNVSCVPYLLDSAVSDWKVKEVDRPKKSKTADEFKVTYTSESDFKEYIHKGDEVIVTVAPVAEDSGSELRFVFTAVEKKLEHIVEETANYNLVVKFADKVLDIYDLDFVRKVE